MGSVGLTGCQLPESSINRQDSAPNIGLYFISGTRKSYNIAKTLSLAGCKVFVRLEPSLKELQDSSHPNYVDRQYCAWLYTDSQINVVHNTAETRTVDAVLYEMCLAPPLYPAELSEWIRRSPHVAAWNSSWHEASFTENIRSELRIVGNFFKFMPKTQSVVLHNGRLFMRPTAIFSRSLCQGAFVHPYFLGDLELCREMFEEPWEVGTLRNIRLIFSGDAASPRRRVLIEEMRKFIMQRTDVRLVSEYQEALSGRLGPGSQKSVLWLPGFNPSANIIPWAKWPPVLRQCDFCLCPPGYEQKSHRVVECLLQGSIPILHCPNEYAIGLTDGVDCIVVRDSDWQTGVRRALEFDANMVAQLRGNVARLVTDELSHEATARRWLGYMGVGEQRL